MEGEIVAFPTETLYGLAVDATNDDALRRLEDVKQRSKEQTFSLIITPEMITPLISSPLLAEDELIHYLIAQYWPGALTLVLPASRDLNAALVHKGCVALRVSSDPIAMELVSRLKRPITATSANLSGMPASHHAKDADLKGVNCTLDDGIRNAEPSTIVSVFSQKIKIIRQGAIDLHRDPRCKDLIVD